MAQPSRIVFTVALGARRYGEMAMGLARSLSLIGDRTPRAILTDLEGFDFRRYFEVVIRKTIPAQDRFLAKLSALEVTEADQVLFLDSDCLAFKRLDPIFAAYEGAPFGVQGATLRSGCWYDKDIAELCSAERIDGLPKFNSGLLYYERSPETGRLFEAIREVARRYDEVGFSRQVGGHDRGAVPDEPCIALAMAQTEIGRVVTDRSNFQNSGVGPVGRLRMDVRRSECRYLCRRQTLETIEPSILHAHFYCQFLIYWRQLRALERLERYEDRRPFGYMSPAHKWSRSIQRRLIPFLYPPEEPRT